MTRSFIVPWFGKLLYGLFFVVLLPLMLIAWAQETEHAVALPVPGTVELGIILAAAGAALMLTGMGTLSYLGGGLPMNAYPPANIVYKGVYRFIPHPIYAGFCILCTGVAMAAHSGSGFWLVVPAVMLGCTALVQGYERHDLRARFGEHLPGPLLALPRAAEERPLLRERLSAYLLVLLPWLLLYELVVSLGIQRHALDTMLSVDRILPVIEWTEIFYAATYVVVAAAPLAARSAAALRQFCIDGLVATVGVTLIYCTLPLIAIPRPFEPETVFGRLILFERAMDTPAAACPSFHVIWALIAGRLYLRSYPRLKALWYPFTGMIIISAITTGAHSIVDVAAAVLFAPLFMNAAGCWRRLLDATERIANSWKEWRFGRVRIINHGVYAGIGTATGLFIIGTLAGPDLLPALTVIALSSVVGAALWAQIIEGSPSLLRPYGYYGGVLGITIASAAAAAAGINLWLLLGLFALAGPWIQMAGRVRCLVQGCCHGRMSPEHAGIRYRHPRSRVVRLAHWENIPVYPTPLYSIVWNAAIGIVLSRLWSLQVPVSMIAGLYLLMNGLGRFVEESYRGEPQTPILGPLRLYQLLAIASVFSGALLTVVPSPAAPIAFTWSWVTAAAALGFGLFTWFALGVDFPDSNRRFARLV